MSQWFQLVNGTFTQLIRDDSAEGAIKRFHKNLEGVGKVDLNKTTATLVEHKLGSTIDTIGKLEESRYTSSEELKRVFVEAGGM